MIELVQANWVVLVVALVIGLLVAWWLFASSRRTRVEIDTSKEEVEAKAPRRNQALMDAPSAAQSAHKEQVSTATAPASTPAGLAGTEAVVGATATTAPRDTLKSAQDPMQQRTAPPSAVTTGRQSTLPDNAVSEPIPPRPPSPPALTIQPPPAAFPVPPDQGLSTLAPDEIDDDLTRIKGLGPKLEMQLRALGVSSLAEIAAWSDADVARIDAQLGRFLGRIDRDDWREQARLLASGDTNGYEDRFGRL